MSAAPLAHLAYRWRGEAERIVRIGERGPAILVLAPLFEEANRTRHFLIETMRGLATHGFRCFLPDLPGTLESPSRLRDLGWDDWSGAVAAAAQTVEPVHVTAFRGGALLDGIRAATYWRLAPVEGSALFRDLIRVRMASLREAGATRSAAELEREALSEPSMIAGYAFDAAFLARMREAICVSTEPSRTVRLDTDAQSADAKLAGQPLWRRSEPGHDTAFSQMVVDDIVDWIATCVGI